MRRIIFGLIVSFCLLPIFVKAECSNNDKERLQKLANNVTYTIDENVNGTFKVTFAGLSDDVRIFNPRNMGYYRNLSNSKVGEVSIDQLQQGETYQFYVYSATTSCVIDRFRTITINVPNINPYYNDDICKNARNYSLCQKFTEVNLSYDEFVQNVSNYIKENGSQGSTIKPQDTAKPFNFLKFYKKYYWPTFIGMILIFIVIIILWIKENKKNKL